MNWIFKSVVLLLPVAHGAFFSTVMNTQSDGRKSNQLREKRRQFWVDVNRKTYTIFKKLSSEYQQVSDAIFATQMPDYASLDGFELKVATEVKKKMNNRFKRFFEGEEKRFR